MKLEDIGYTSLFEEFRIQNKLERSMVGRVVSEHKERYIIRTEKGEFEGEILGNLRYSAKNRADFPAIGDWVGISEFDTDKVIVHTVFKRKTLLERLAVGKFGEKQIIAANIDFGLIVQSVDRDFNANRLDRYLSVCQNSDIKPILILSKTDLIVDDSLKDLLKELSTRISDIPVVPLSNESQLGYDKLKTLIIKGKTYCLLGSSGVGKSTLYNNLAGKDFMKTGAISHSTHKGRHVTSHRELILLESGGILIDNPGMREIGIVDSEHGLELTFDKIYELAGECRFNDCSHTGEKGCKVIEAVKNGTIDQMYYENYLKLEREKEHFESSVADKRKKDKEFGKMVKRVKKLRGDKN